MTMMMMKIMMTRQNKIGRGDNNISNKDNNDCNYIYDNDNCDNIYINRSDDNNSDKIKITMI